MRWELVEQKINEIVTNAGAEFDPFERMAYWSGESKHESRIAMTVKRSLGYGEFSVSATVSMSCPQNERFIDLAAEVAYTKALELVNDGFCNVVQDAERIGEPK